MQAMEKLHRKQIEDLTNLSAQARIAGNYNQADVYEKHANAIAIKYGIQKQPAEATFASSGKEKLAMRQTISSWIEWFKRNRNGQNSTAEVV